jgi:hypothetical protein
VSQGIRPSDNTSRTRPLSGRARELSETRTALERPERSDVAPTYRP